MARHRGGHKGNQAELVDAIVKLSNAIAGEAAGIAEIEINPFMLRPQGSCAVDAVVMRARMPPNHPSMRARVRKADIRG